MARADTEEIGSETGTSVSTPSGIDPSVTDTTYSTDSQPSIIPGWGENTMVGADFSASAPPASSSLPSATPGSTMPSSLDPYTPDKIAGVQQDLAGIARDRGDRMEKNQGLFETHLARDRQQMDSAWRSTRAAADAIPPKWDADAERQARVRGPIENFGSIASVFGILASAFTRTPLTSALNASAAAMTAIRESDEHGYKSAYDAWKENTNLALKRYEIERQSFQDSNKLLETDMSLWRARTLADAARFDNKKVITMLEAGMDKEILDMQHAGIKAASDLVKVRQEWETFDIRRGVYSTLVQSWDKNNPDAPPEQQALARMQILESVGQGGGNSWQVNILRNARLNALAEGRIMTPAEESRIIERMHTLNRGSNNPEWVYIQQRVQELTTPQGDGVPGMSPTEAMRQAETEWRASHTSPSKSGSQADFITRRAKELQDEQGLSRTEAEKQAAGEWKKAQQAPAREGSQQDYMAKRVPEMIAEGKSETEARRDAAAEWERAKAKGRSDVPSGNRRDQLASAMDRVDAANQTIDKVEALLKKHKAMTGLGGTITRPGEVVSNWFGSNETDRAQFRSYIEELREWGARIMNESHSRPLAAEEKRIAAIVPGLNPGDTTVNTAKRLLEVQSLFKQLRGNLQKRWEGTWSPDQGLPPAKGSTPAGGGNKPAWEEAPIISPAPGQRSSVDEGRVISDETPFGLRAGQQYAQAQDKTKYQDVFTWEGAREILNKKPPDYPLPRTTDMGSFSVIEDFLEDQQPNEYNREGAEAAARRYRKIRDQWGKKAKPGDKLLLYNSKGNQFYHERDDDYDGGWSIWFPPKETSALGDEGRVVSDEGDDPVRLGAQYAAARRQPGPDRFAEAVAAPRTDRRSRTDRDADPLDPLPSELPPRRRIDQAWDDLNGR